MKQILTITQKDVEPSYAELVDVVYRDRFAARAVLFDVEGRVALLHATVPGYFKLPGGGVEQGEDMSLALARELLEEVGAEAEVFDEVGRVEEWRVSDAGALHQISDAYLARVTGEISDPDFTESELAEGFEVYWANDVTEAINLVSTMLAHDDPRVRFMCLRDKAILEAAK